jgi:DNA polymerase epsilon subunit 2
VEGEYTEDGILEVVAMGQPPCEDRETARYARLCFVSEIANFLLCLLTFNRSIYGHIDFLGQGSTSLLEDVRHPTFGSH